MEDDHVVAAMLEQVKRPHHGGDLVVEIALSGFTWQQV
jgi:hypothetical protein